MLGLMALRRWLWTASVLSLQLLPSAAAAESACKIIQIAELHVGRRGNSPYTDGEVNGQPVQVLLDTGSYDSFITSGAARRMQLHLRDSDRRARGVNGEVTEQFAVVDHLKIGKFVADDLLLHVTGPGLGRTEDDIGFVLGADFFAHFTTEFDLAHDAVRLLQPHDCKPEQLVYWDREYFLADLDRLGANNALLITHLTVNGVRVSSLLDTGSAITLISTATARRAGVKPGDPGVQPSTPMRGVAGTPMDTWVGRFDTLNIGDETARNARLRIADLFGADRDSGLGSHITRVGDDLPDMILGADFFQAHRVVILPREHAALFTYAGGPVFQVVRPNETAAPTPPSAAAP
jgi:predicted aspartyl protease